MSEDDEPTRAEDDAAPLLPTPAFAPPSPDSELDRLRGELLTFLVNDVARQGLSERAALGPSVTAAIRDAVDQAARRATTASRDDLQAEAEGLRRGLIEAGGADIEALTAAVAERLPSRRSRAASLPDWALVAIGLSLTLAGFAAGCVAAPWLIGQVTSLNGSNVTNQSAPGNPNLAGQVDDVCEPFRAIKWPTPTPTPPATPSPVGSPAPQPSGAASDPQAALRRLADGPLANLCGT